MWAWEVWDFGIDDRVMPSLRSLEIHVKRDHGGEYLEDAGRFQVIPQGNAGKNVFIVKLKVISSLISHFQIHDLETLLLQALNQSVRIGDFESTIKPEAEADFSRRKIHYPEKSNIQHTLCPCCLVTSLCAAKKGALSYSRIIAGGAGQERLSDCICTVDQQDVKIAWYTGITFGHVNGIRADVTFHVLASTTLIEEEADESQLKRKL
ncbi:hypothetical protein JRO89_XS09G0191100 [Xanthoceras sorbifolium]|uniref:Uncharacterized protein n=1 Tax=Xanthoceras sorbifolium TaxID=99658 RepID=A0ABQ8HLW9_9ROSI|nr:hypothetical protein JRO89_XS09G0191100 [Xanthoceras sorbifolium]